MLSRGIHHAASSSARSRHQMSGVRLPGSGAAISNVRSFSAPIFLAGADPWGSGRRVKGREVIACDAEQLWNSRLDQALDEQTEL